MSNFVAGRATCVMATSGRAGMAARSCELFSRQDYPDRELVIVADRGEITPDPSWGEMIILLEVASETPIGTRRNLACHHSSGEWILQWDDDDWRGAGSISALVTPLSEGKADIVGFLDTPFYDIDSGAFWNTDPILEKVSPGGIHPGTLAFKRDVWERHRYPARTGGEDLGLLGFAKENGARVAGVDSLGGEHFIYVRHGENTWKLQCGESHGKDSWATIPAGHIPSTAHRWLSEWSRSRRDTKASMVGVTVASPLVRKMAEEAAERFTWATGIPAYVRIEASDLCYRAKFDLPKAFGGTVIYFDADLWFLRKTDLSPYYDHECFLAALDPGRFEPGHFPLHDCGVLGINPATYFNSALMIWNQRHLAMWEAAQQIDKDGVFPNLNDPHEPAEGGQRLKDFGEQSYINAAVQRSNTPFYALPDSFNYMPYAAREMRDYPKIPNPVACHAAGYAIEHKRDFLQFCARQWSEKKP